MQDFVPHSSRSPEEPTPLSGPSSLLPDSLIKLERHSPPDTLCLSPSSPSSQPIPSFTNIPSFTSGRTPTPTTRRKRTAYPYTNPPPRVSSGRRQSSSSMSAPHYDWSSNAVKYEQPEYPSGDLSHTQRRASDGDQPPYFFTPVSSFARIRGGAVFDARCFARIPLCAGTAQKSAPTLRDP